MKIYQAYLENRFKTAIALACLGLIIGGLSTAVKDEEASTGLEYTGIILFAAGALVALHKFFGHARTMMVTNGDGPSITVDSPLVPQTYYDTFAKTLNNA